MTIVVVVVGVVVVAAATTFMQNRQRRDRSHAVNNHTSSVFLRVILNLDDPYAYDPLRSDFNVR